MVNAVNQMFMDSCLRTEPPFFLESISLAGAVERYFTSLHEVFLSSTPSKYLRVGVNYGSRTVYMEQLEQYGTSLVSYPYQLSSSYESSSLDSERACMCHVLLIFRCSRADKSKNWSKQVLCSLLMHRKRKLIFKQLRELGCTRQKLIDIL